MAKKTIQRGTLTQQLVELLKTRMAEGDLKSGDRMWPAELADEYETSIVPVKEALIILQSEGLIKNIPRRGSIIRQFSEKEMEELYDIRLLIEVESVKIALTNNTVDAALISKLVDTNDKMQAMREGDEFSNPRAAYQLDQQFHDLIVKASNHDALREWYDRLNAQMKIIRLSSWNIGPRGKKTTIEHEAIIEALEGRDFTTVQIAVEKHLSSIRTDFRSTLSLNAKASEVSDSESVLPHGRRKVQHA